MTVRVSTIALTLALCVACGGKSGSNGGNAGGAGNTGSAGGAAAGSVTESQFRAQVPALYCQTLQTCCEQAGFSYSPLLCMGLSTPMAPAAGVVFNADAAASCLQLLQGGSCESSGTAMPSPCNEVYTGTKALGAACTGDQDCLPQSDGQVECDGFEAVCTVTRRGELGDACNASCEELGGDLGGYVCGNFDNPELAPSEKVQCYRDDGLTCGELLTCQALVGSGEACSSDRDCIEGTYCSFGGIDPVCAPLLQMGAACTAFGEQCDDTSYCDATNTCVARKPNGAACTGIDQECQGQCSNGACEPGGDLGTGLLGLFCGGGPVTP